ncbi:hypothetical protein DCAR_0415332 [Daucus carota subsp. sativus]|uniref:Uncharacterized protein n=1 Tax=Daucus carota subsp. sativus TaxID=79200 RepID=A0AAF1AWV9_DAUCS|nr:hypothetical protein DCAR_0415332 [Daucus carota subsp. sativus]
MFYKWQFHIRIIFISYFNSLYNEGTTDFKMTHVYQELIQSKELLEEPDEFKYDVFKSNPTEQAPILE